MFRPPDVWQRLKGSNQFLEAAEGQQRGLAWRLGGEIRASNGDISVPACLQLDQALPHVARRSRDAC